MYEALERNEREGFFRGERGQAILAAAKAVDPDAESGAAASRRDAGTGASSVGQGRAENEGRADPASAVLEANAKQFTADLSAARNRSLRENAATAHPTSIETEAGGKAAVMAADSYALWHRAGLQSKLDAEGQAWRGMTLPRTLANKIVMALRSMAGSAPSEAGGAQAAAGYDRLVKAIESSRYDDGGVTILRGDYRPDTVREEMLHRWQQLHKMTNSDAIHQIAQRPEVKEIATKLREMGYGLKPGVEGRSELAMEMMAKAMAGDVDLKLTDDQRYDLVHSFVSVVRDEMGPKVLDAMPAVAPEAEAAIKEARTYYEPDEGSSRQTARSQSEGDNEGSGRRSGVGQRAHNAGGAESTPARNERSADQTGAAESELKPAYQGRGRLPGEIALPGMEDAVRAQNEAADAQRREDLTAQMNRPAVSIDKKAGEMERHSPLFSGTDANPQGASLCVGLHLAVLIARTRLDAMSKAGPSFC